MKRIEKIPKTQALTPYTLKVVKGMVDSGFLWIARDRDGRLFTYSSYPEKLTDKWEEQTDIMEDGLWNQPEPMYLSEIGCKNLDLSFVKWSDEEPTNLQELIDNCKVVDNITF